LYSRLNCQAPPRGPSAGAQAQLRRPPGEARRPRWARPAPHRTSSAVLPSRAARFPAGARTDRKPAGSASGRGV